ncbi:conserved hypothetical protein [Leishmania major strain Friedlin]|uniref:Uncharacterized protein n=1 Tax=Leishmania major TaxID=5664 RepID=Q4Q7I7_LEIMA|nr:conserved hypothetical protein [Leishmania major strain Friedlin]CAG9578312.1 hypothetical_protein_-_conserved [Leishmania major strain Friedlin]CAJ06159.2 conserved hypothetical protein [Leishmania major strain Friedlin]|eukprot:XP_001684711.2 conserved hypothetical protein [Leishmania major strain Friedlin]
MMLAKSSDKRRHCSRGERATALMPRHGETEVNSVDAGSSPPFHQHLFSSSGTVLLEDMLEEEEEGGGGGERLVLHFDSSPPSSSPPFAPRTEAAVDDDAPPDVVEGVNSTTATVATPSTLRLPAQDGTTAAPRIAAAAPESSARAPLSTAATESVGASFSGAPRRLLLLRPDTGDAPCSLSTASSTAVPPAAPLSSALSSARGGRVLRISTAAAAKSDTLSAEPAQGAPDTPLPACAVTTRTAATEATSSTLKVAAPALSTTPVSASETAGTPESREWQPFLLSFAYPVCSTDATTTAQKLPPLLSAPAAMKGRRAIVVHLEFVAVVVGATTSGPDAASIAAHCSRGSVASCGWSSKCLSTDALSPDVAARDTTHRTSHGYSVIIGDASLASRCFMCPLVAAVLPGNSGRCYDATCKLPTNSGTGEVRAGPLLDVWVRAVSGRQLSAQQRGHRNARELLSSMPEIVLKDQPRPQQGAATLEGATRDEGTCRAPAMQSSSCELSQPLSTTVFTASWLSQLCCVFTPCHLATSPYRHPHAGNVRRPRPARRSLWPSSRSPSLVWVATQVTQDCVVTHPRCLTGSTSSPPLRASEPKGKVRYYWLRSDPRQSDALHRHLCRVFACWASATSAPLSASSSHLCASPCAASDVVTASSLLDIVVTKANPPTLSLRGGAVGTASAVLVADETLHTAELEAEDAAEAPSAAPAAPLVAAAERRRLSPSALRARVAITAAVLQHLMWGAVERSDTSCKGEASRAATLERKAMSDPERTPSTPPPPGEQCVVHLEGVTSRLVCAARALAVHWVCGSPSLLHNAPASLMGFLTEEQQLLSSILPVRRLLSGICARVAKGFDACDPVRAPSTTWLDMLHHFATEYASASLAALTWLSQHAVDTQLLREEGLVSLRLHEAERALLCSAPALPTSSRHGGLVRHRLSSGKGPAFRLGSYTEESHQRFSRDDGTTVVGRSVLQAPLRGKVKVRVEHAAVMNAFMVHLEWTTTMSAAVYDAPPLAPFPDVHAAVELPFLLLVFVVAEDVDGTAHDSADSSWTSDDKSLRGPHGVGGCAVRLYQATPFSWYVSAATCTANGFAARTTQLLTHALDLVARQPGVFEGFHLQAVTGLGSGATTTAAGSTRTRTTLKRTRGRRRGTGCADGVGEGGASATAVLSKHGALGADTAAARRSRARPRAGKRRRTGVNDNDDGRSEGSETSSDNEDGTIDSEVDDDDASILVLHVGSSRGFRAAAAAASPPDSAPARCRRPDSGFHKSSSNASLSVFDTARVIPVVVFRQDAAAPLLEVEVSQASQLAAQLAAFGSRATRSAGRNAKDEDDPQEEASRVLCALLDHWIGFSSLHAAAPHYVASLQASQRHGALTLTTQLGSLSSQTGALTERCVLYAYADLLRSLWRELAHLSESSPPSTETSPSASSPLTRFVSVAALRAHVLDPVCVAAAIEAAIAEYERQDIECRKRLLAAKWYAAAQWALGEAEEEEKKKKEGGAGNTGGARRSKPRKQTQQQQRQRQEAEASTEAAARATWASLTMQTNALVRAFYAEVLRAFPLASPPLPTDNQPRTIHAEVESGSFCGTSGRNVLPRGVSSSWSPTASEKRATLLSCLRGLLQSVEVEEEGPPPPRRGDTTVPTSPAFRLQLTGASADKVSLLQTLPSSLKSRQWRATGAGAAADLNVTVAQLAETCVAQLSCTPSHSCLRLAGATSASARSGKKRVEKVAPWPVAGDDAAAQRAAELLLVSDALLLPRGKRRASAASAHGQATAAKLALPLAQLMMNAEAMLH